jgi:hypothetical protein
MKTAEEIYNEYSSNPIKWKTENNCLTTKDTTIKLMELHTRLHLEAFKRSITSHPLIHDFDADTIKQLYSDYLTKNGLKK